VDAVASHFAAAGFDILLLALDDFDWAGTFPWGKSARTRVVRDRGQKYVVAARHLDPAALRADGVSHVLVWDNDALLSESFDAAALLALLQAAPGIAVAAPFVDGGCHFMCDAGMKAAAQRGDAAHAVRMTPEMMYAAYSLAAWACMRERIVLALGGETPELWGIDSISAGCVCADAGAAITAGQFVLMHPAFTVSHGDTGSLTRSSTFNHSRAVLAGERIQALARSGDPAAWGPCVRDGDAVRQANDNFHSAEGVCFVPAVDA
jgi:hypothetical protein